jgi:glutaminyl-tRNA synthetase
MVQDDGGARRDFIRQIIEEHNRSGKYGGRVVTRFPPEPNGYLHIGHAKAITTDFGIALEYGGRCHLRFDDTNPSKESTEFVESIIRDVRWLGFDWGPHLYYASDYFPQCYEYGLALIRTGHAYVCDLDAEQVSEYRGQPTRPGRPSPWRERPVAESVDLFQRMRAGEFPDGARTLRARIDMGSPNMNLRDPVLYRIQKTHHHRTGDEWPIYPMYDYAHPISDSIEGVTHSLCTLEFENHRPLYDWVLESLGIYQPQQIEFARMNVTFTIMSKRKLAELVAGGHVEGWDDPRLPTLSGMRRRGYTPAAIRDFCDRFPLSKKSDSLPSLALLEHCVRDDLNRTAPRAMAVLDPLRVVLENYPEGRVEEFEAPVNPEDPAAGSRRVPFSRVLYIERDDFREDPPRKFYRLSPGREVRLRAAYLVTCTDVVKDASGAVVELRCRYDPDTRGGDAPDGRKVKGTLHWVSAAHAVDAEVRLYDTLCTEADPEAGEGSFLERLNPRSLEVRQGCKLEPALARAAPGERFQFERLGYFCADTAHHESRPVFNRTVPLRDTWAKIQASEG